MQATHSPTATATDQRPPAPAWGGVFALSLGAFALVAAEFMPVSLLTAIAADLRVSEGQAGQSIAVSGAFALIASLALSALAGGIDRKRLLLALTMLMIVSGSVAAFAPDYATFMVGRAFLGVAIGGFWSMSAATAMRLVPAAQVPKALAIVNGGNALATVVAAPLGSLLGALVGWRGAFFCLVPVALVALAWSMLSLPSMPASALRSRRSMLTLLKSGPVALGMVAVSLFFMGEFALLTYLRPFLDTVTHASAATTALMLLLIGVAGFIGTVLIGALVKHHLVRALVAIPLVMAALGLALIAFGSSTLATAALLAVWGLVGTSAPVLWWSWLARTLPDDAETGGGLMVAVVQLAIATGAAFGGLLFDAHGYQATFGLSALILLVAAAFAAAAAPRDQERLTKPASDSADNSRVH
ncbi:MFS transporter [Massilia sp. DWR3-1-1]|uniref:MFS transporter n=1 Tax=Massilia sp. DWR3-1-1 TaxID=2804559 RepID=UPI003CF826B5